MRPVPGFEGGQAVFFCKKAKTEHIIKKMWIV